MDQPFCTNHNPAAFQLLLRSSLYRELAAEREEIMRHKWIESEKAGRDIGYESALVNWIVHHRAGWKRSRHRQSLSIDARINE